MKNIPLIVVGDSIMWGQGLAESEKMYTLVRNRLAGYLGIDAFAVDLHRYAHSGAPIATVSNDDAPPTWGEVPVSPPSLTHQIQMAYDDLPACRGPSGAPCLVLVTGGIETSGSRGK